MTDRRSSEDYQPLSQLMQPVMDEIEAIGARGDLGGVPTGFAELDDLTGGLHPGQMVILAARPGVGKALALDTLLPTEAGWSTMGSVEVGDRLIGSDGQPTTVVATTDVLIGRRCFEITFSDGSRVVADSHHEWVATSRAARRAAGERKPPRYYHPLEAIERIQSLAREGADDARMVTMREAEALVGGQFRSALHASGHAIGPVRGSRPAGELRRPGRVFYYPYNKLMSTLAAFVSRPASSWVAPVHDKVVTTETIAASVRLPDGRCNWSVRIAQEIDLPERTFTVDPYFLGAWLGDGTSAQAHITSADPPIISRIRDMGYSIVYKGHLRYAIFRTTCSSCGTALPSGRAWPSCGHQRSSVRQDLRGLGVLDNKHIPVEYQRAGIGQRRALLAGLLDTDGTVDPGGGVSFTSTSRRLADDTFELIAGLGYRPWIHQKSVAGRSPASSIAYTIGFSTSDDVFSLDRKNTKHRALRAPNRRLTSDRFIVAVREIDSVPVRCVQVDNQDHTYLVGRAMIPTHNSTLALDLARSASIRHGLPSAFFSLEMSRLEITMRLLSAEASVPLAHIRSGRMSDADWERISSCMGRVSEAPMYIDDSPNLTIWRSGRRRAD